MKASRCLYFLVGLNLIFIIAGTSTLAGVKVFITSGRLTIEASGVPLRDILTRINDQGVGIKIGPDINPLVTASFANESITAGLDRILGSLNHALIWDQVEGPLGPIPRLAEIQIFEAGARQAMAPLEHRPRFELARNSANGAAYVRNEILIGLGKEMDAAKFHLLLEKIGGTVLGSHGATGIYRIRMGGDQDIPDLADRLNALEGVDRAEPNWAYRLPTRQALTAPAGDGTGPDAQLAGDNGIPIAVLDSGLQSTAQLDALTIASLDALAPGTPISDTLGHGTQMALVASGSVTPWNAESPTEGEGNPIIAVRAFDDSGVTSNFALMESVDFALAQGAKVMSLSWGTETPSQFLENTMNYGHSQGLIIVAAAGNKPTGKPYYPAAYPAIIGVGALDETGRPWEKSNYGDFVTLSASGIATLPVGHQGDPGVYTGTSIATAFVANLIAQALAADPDADIAAILAGIEQ